MRKKKSLFNIIFSLGSYFIAMLLNFITQAMIVKNLGIEYSGVNGLFTNILTMLSLAELGIGSAIIFKLYEPIAKKNIEKIKSWLYFYRICYRYVALFVFIVGFFAIPLVPTIVGATTIHENIIILYVISLADIIISYSLSYKRSLLYADQKNYIIDIIHIGYVVLMNLSQILVLIFTRNYLFYLIIRIIYRILENVVINFYVNYNYPYIKSKSLPLSRSEKKDVFSRVKAMFMQRISLVVNKGIDNILISLFLGVSSVGYYTNYYLVVSTISGIVYQIISGFGASIGNLLVEKNKSKNYKIYRVIDLLNSSISTICIVGFVCCIQPFVLLWLGKDFLLSIDIILAFSIYIYCDSSRRSITIFKDAAGICKEDKYAYLLMALINLLSSIVLCKFMGMSGVIIGTSISYLFLILYSYPKYIFKKLFDKCILDYYSCKIKFIFVIVISLAFSYYICSFIKFDSLIGFILNFFVSIIIPIIIIFIIYHNSEEFIYLKSIIFEFIRKKGYSEKKQ